MDSGSETRRPPRWAAIFRASRFDRGSWVALAFALLVIGYNLVSGILAWSTPTDGWLIDVRPVPGITFVANAAGMPSGLRPGDDLVAVDGVPVADVFRASHEFYRQQAPAWEDGHILQYTVQRGGEQVTVPVPVRRVGPVESFVTLTRLNRPGRTELQVVSSLLIFGIGWLVFLLRPRERAAHALLMLGAAFVFQTLGAIISVPSLFYPLMSRPLSVAFNYWTCVIIPSLLYLMLAFPAPKFPLSRWPRAVPALLYLIWTPAYVIVYLSNLHDPAAYDAVATTLSVAGLPLVVPALILFIIAFLRERDLAARAQFKWLALGLFGFIGIGIGGWFAGAFFVGFEGVAGDLAQYAATLGWLMLPVSLAFAVTRTRLFDIDVIIRRTLVYSILTALLALVYFGAVVLLQRLLRDVAGPSPDLAIVVSTLAMAVLFAPLRRQVQAVIDRRFYRRKYDAAKTLAAFGETVRDETDLDRLAGRLVEVAEDTMQPATASLWLKATGDRRRQRAAP